MEDLYDYIIVGQGIAGTLLTYLLQKRGAHVLVIDKYNGTSSTNISGGILHPITGRRKVKTWMADILVPFDEEFFTNLQKEFGEQLYHKLNILELVDSTKDYNDWIMRSSDNEVKHYFSNEETEGLYDDVIAPSKKISLKHCGWLDLKKISSIFRKQLVDSKMLIDETFSFEDLKINEDEVTYKDIKAKRIIFCDGWLATQNPYWSWLPFLPAKGEILTIHCPDLKITHILLKNLFILPLGNDLYKIGSNYEWKELNEIPTQKTKEDLLNKLKQVLTVPFEVVDHKAAVRPAIQDRRPIIGFHPKHKCIGIFNGLGTKGVLLAPYFANHFVQYLYGEQDLNSEVDVKRFK